jgi:hypothetical protein
MRVVLLVLICFGLCSPKMALADDETQMFWAYPFAVEKGEDFLHPILENEKLPKKVRLRRTFDESTERLIQGLKNREFHVALLVECSILDDVSGGHSTDRVSIRAWLSVPFAEGESPKAAIRSVLNVWRANGRVSGKRKQTSSD